MSRTKPKTAQPPEPTPKSRLLVMTAKAGLSEDRMLADLVADGEATNASTAMRFVKGDNGEMSLTDMVAALRSHGEAVNRGDLSAAERMLNAQAVALNAIFGELARRAALNMGTHLAATESYLRLALKAQSQSRATVETLAAMKNPPVVFARQANINNGGQQQVNNATESVNPPVPRGCAPAHAAISEAQKTELLEASHGQRLDTRTARAAGGADPHLETVAAVHRPTHG